MKTLYRYPHPKGDIEVWLGSDGHEWFAHVSTLPHARDAIGPCRSLQDARRAAEAAREHAITRSEVS